MDEHRHTDDTETTPQTSRRNVLKRVGIGLAGAASLAALGTGQASASGYCYVCCHNPCVCPPTNGGGNGHGKKKNKKNKKNKGNNGFGNGGGDGVPGNSGKQDRSR